MLKSFFVALALICAIPLDAAPAEAHGWGRHHGWGHHHGWARGHHYGWRHHHRW
jgi:Spy/CpxP family protein refolding chaperone